MIVDYIDTHRSRFGVDPICAVLTEHGISIAPSTYYKAKQRGPISDTDLGEAYAANAVHRVYVANKRLYGARKIWWAMKHAGHDIGRDQVAPPDEDLRDPRGGPRQTPHDHHRARRAGTTTPKI